MGPLSIIAEQNRGPGVKTFILEKPNNGGLTKVLQACKRDLLSDLNRLFK